MPSLATDWRSNIPGWARRKRRCSSSTSCWSCILTTPAVTSWRRKLSPGRNEMRKPKPCSRKELNQPNEPAIATPRMRCKRCSTNCDLLFLGLSRIPQSGVRDRYDLPSCLAWRRSHRLFDPIKPQARARLRLSDHRITGSRAITGFFIIPTSTPAPHPPVQRELPASPLRSPRRPGSAQPTQSTVVPLVAASLQCIC